MSFVRQLHVHEVKAVGSPSFHGTAVERKATEWPSLVNIGFRIVGIFSVFCPENSECIDLKG